MGEHSGPDAQRDWLCTGRRAILERILAWIHGLDKAALLAAWPEILLSLTRQTGTSGLPDPR